MSPLGTSPDRRRLGIALGRISILHAGGHRWTKGHAELPVDSVAGLTGFLQLELQVTATLRYRAPASHV